MNVLQIGSIAILYKWVFLGIAIFIGYISIRVWLQSSTEKKNIKPIMDLLFNTIFLSFLVWKGSLLLLEPSIILKSPFSILYFTGGSKGLILAIIFSFAYFFLKAKKLEISNEFIIKLMFIFSLVVLTAYHGLTVFFIEEDVLYHSLISLFMITVLVIGIFKKDIYSLKWIYMVTIVFSFVHFILIMILIKSQAVFLFSVEQWFLIGIILVSLFHRNKLRSLN
ncbi:hypothetical protein SM124_11000 [Bacillus sp. 31A1R]|uniref:YhhN-like protein n=1 Tax=Robertmurraya mangrovi TaxID=3098077 RepID=A0ABU5IYL8_9BACI|nr:hypothetical protein [Bacillus sp. 31A1R]MDZ5472275.1 hypothetical protein [Bacillus sp. 31A1R]